MCIRDRDDLEAVAAAMNAYRQEAGGVQDLARDIDREIAGGFSAGMVAQPAVNGAEIQVFVELPRPVDDSSSHPASGRIIMSNERSNVYIGCGASEVNSPYESQDVSRGARHELSLRVPGDKPDRHRRLGPDRPGHSTASRKGTVPGESPGHGRRHLARRARSRARETRACLLYTSPSP